MALGVWFGILNAEQGCHLTRSRHHDDDISTGSPGDGGEPAPGAGGGPGTDHARERIGHAAGGHGSSRCLLPEAARARATRRRHALREPGLAGVRSRGLQGLQLGGDWTFALTDYIELGADISYYSKPRPSVYRDFVDDDGTEIEQDLKLRIIPITAMRPIRADRAPLEGAALHRHRRRVHQLALQRDRGIHRLRRGGQVFPAKFEADGTEVAPVVLGGVRFLATDAFTIGGEVRWQKASGDTGGICAKASSARRSISGGWTTNFSSVSASSWQRSGSREYRARAPSLPRARLTPRPNPATRPTARLKPQRRGRRAERVASFRMFLARCSQPAWPRGAEHREPPDLAVSFVQEVLDLESRVREVVHVVRERSHAHHDRARRRSARADTR